MKKFCMLSRWLFLLILSFVIFSGCKKKDVAKPAPIISFIPDTDSVEVDIFDKMNDIVFLVSVSADAGINTFEIKKKNGGQESVYTNINSSSSIVFYTFTYKSSEQKNDLEKSAPVIFTFIITDKQAQTTSKTFTITKKPDLATIKLSNEKYGVLWNIQGSNKGAWDLQGDSSVSSSVSDNYKDMKNTTSQADLTALSYGFRIEWTAVTQTRFAKTDSFNYSEPTAKDAHTAYNNGTAVSTITSPAVGDVYIAKLRGYNDYAVIKITNIALTAIDNVDKIEFSYKKK